MMSSTNGGGSKSNRLFASVIGLLLFIAVQFVIFIDYGVIVSHNSVNNGHAATPSATPPQVVLTTETTLSTTMPNHQSTAPLTALALGERPMRRREWKPYLKAKYADVLASTLRFELVALFTPERAPDDEPHDANYHVDNAPKRTAKIYRKWLEMQAEIKAHDEAIRLWKEARSEAGEDDDDDAEEEAVDDDVIESGDEEVTE